MNLLGLPYDFVVQNGKFSLTQGIGKLKNRYLFLLQFTRLRIYMADFNPGFETWIQKPASFLIMYETVLISGLAQLITKYIPENTTNNLQIVSSKTDRKSYGLLIEYTFTPTKDKSKTVIFVG